MSSDIVVLAEYRLSHMKEEVYVWCKEWLSFFWFCSNIVGLLQEEFEDTKRVIRIRISKKNKTHHHQEKKYKRKNNDPQNTPKTKDRVTRTPLNQLINLTRRF